MTSDSVAEVFGALADSTRQQIVDWLLGGRTATATELAGRLPMSRQGVTRHLAELEKAGLVTRHRIGREVRYRLQPDALSPAVRWLDERAARWDATLERLAQHVERSHGPPR